LQKEVLSWKNFQIGEFKDDALQKGVQSYSLKMAVGTALKQLESVKLVQYVNFV
jgi:hypothetical protein